MQETESVMKYLVVIQVRGEDEPITQIVDAYSELEASEIVKEDNSLSAGRIQNIRVEKSHDESSASTVDVGEQSDG